MNAVESLNRIILRCRIARSRSSLRKLHIFKFFKYFEKVNYKYYSSSYVGGFRSGADLIISGVIPQRNYEHCPLNDFDIPYEAHRPHIAHRTDG